MIAGRGVVSPLGVGLQGHCEGLLAGRSVISKCERLSSLGFPLTRAGQISEKELEQIARLIPRKQRKLMNRAGVLAAIASFFAVEEAGFGQAGIDPTRLGVFLATWFTYFEFFSFIRYLGETQSEEEPSRMDSEKANRNWLRGMNPVDCSLKVLPNLTAGHLAILHQAQGYSRLVADGWRGGLLAVAQAAEAIRHGEVDVALAGGSEAALEEGIFCDLSGLEIMARDGTGQDQICRPFDLRRNGTVFGEGAGVVLLEERGHALKRGVTIHGEVLGWASSAPGKGKGRGQALTHSMKRALLDAGMEPGDVDLVHANGDSTFENDFGESLAIRSVFGELAPHLPVTATKSLHGHLLSAAGGVELVSCLIMLEQGIIPPIANCDRPGPECEVGLVRGLPRERPHMRTAMLNAMGLFGEGASLVIRR
ncbi:MAG: beta-ketoacyl-[acyl-carrier-protein] synthase family protein [Candidatus Binatia bacterium]